LDLAPLLAIVPRLGFFSDESITCVVNDERDAFCSLGHTEEEKPTMSHPNNWQMDESGKALVRSFSFADFSEAFAFLTRIALHAEKVDHHPEFTSVWNRVDFRLTSHDAGGITDRDRALADAISRLAGD
jgi:4a-hydroxytetrahydrobiopterin dehydratase